VPSEDKTNVKDKCQVDSNVSYNRLTQPRVQAGLDWTSPAHSSPSMLTGAHLDHLTGPRDPGSQLCLS
jgi:hypothetical protein